VPCGPVITRDQVFSNQQVVENEFFVHRDQPGLGRVQEMGFPLHFSEASSHIQRTAPLLGAHTDEVLQEFGFASEEVEGLKARGTVA
jgi:crotonobetainyl-CoA:carnitine CoA-transferase CaiB-like acyl-CoA transferase